MFIYVASPSMVWDAFDQVILGSHVQAEAANDAPVRHVDASANANRAAVMQMMCMYVAKSTMHAWVIHWSGGLRMESKSCLPLIDNVVLVPTAN